MALGDNITRVRGRIEAACARAGRPVDSVRLIAVSKGFPAATVVAAAAAGLSDFGENRVQEAEGKIGEVAASGPVLRWHLVGHLQSNKAKSASRLFSMIHSVDSIRLAQELSRRAHHLAILLEVNVAQEPSKFGFTPREVAAALSEISQLPHLDVRGLMTVAPLADTAEAVRPVFRELRELRDALGLAELSMGMTDDFEVAIEEGATMVRVGRAIFGERPR
jgi:pyridoxal phosphate enzyme (YggS family)